MDNVFQSTNYDTRGIIFSSNQIPNGWGRQVYNRRYRRLYKDKQIEVNNGRKNYSFIVRFVKQNISGSRLRNRLNRKREIF